MNGKGTCPRLLVKKHKIRPDAYEGCRDAGGKSAGVMSTIAIRSQMSDFSTSADSSEAERGSGMWHKGQQGNPRSRELQAVATRGAPLGSPGDSCHGSKMWRTALKFWGFQRAQSDDGIVCWHPVHCGRFNLTLSSKAISLTFFLISQVPKAFSHSLTLIPPPLIPLTISVYRSPSRSPVWLLRCLTEREKRNGRGEMEGERKKRCRLAEGGMSFTDVPPGYTHSSRAVHPVLFRPHLRRSSHTTRHVRTPHTLSNMHSSSSSSSSSSRNGAHSSSSMLPIGQEVVTFFFLPAHYCFPLASRFLRAPVFSLWLGELFSISPGRLGTKCFW